MSSSPNPRQSNSLASRPVRRWALPALCALMVLILIALTVVVVQRAIVLETPGTKDGSPVLIPDADKPPPELFNPLGAADPGKRGVSSTQSSISAPAPEDPKARAVLEELQEAVTQAVQEGKGRQMIPAVERFVLNYPSYAPARTLLGQLFLDTNQFEKALAQFQVGLELDARQPELRILTGMMAQKLGREELALNQYQAAIDQDPRQVRYRLHLAQLHMQGKRYDQARNVLLGTIQLDSSAHKAYAMLAQLYAQQNRLTLAIEQAQKAIENTPANQQDVRLDYVRQKAVLLRRDNRPDEALQTLNILPVGQQHTLTVMEDQALCWAMLGNPGRAATIFEAAIERDPTDFQAAIRAAEWRLKAGEPDLARRHWNLMRSLKPRAPEVEQIRKQLDSGPATMPATQPR